MEESALRDSRRFMDDPRPIFISYRRSDAAGHARALHEYLSGRFGDERIFFDRSTIESGNVFPKTIREGIEGCAVLLALIGPDWLETKGTGGGRRLDDPNDRVRQEIALALARGKEVIPVLFDDTPEPPVDRLPAPLKKLADCDALTLRGKTYEYRTQRSELVRLLTKVPGVPAPFVETGEAIGGSAAAELPALTAAATRELRELSDAQRETIRTLERQLGANEAQLNAFFQIIDVARVPPEQQPARLIEIATQWRQLRAQVGPKPGDVPEVVRLREAALVALNAEQFQEVDDLLAQVETAQHDAVDQQRQEIERQQREFELKQMDWAATAAQRAGNALTRLRYREAAEHFAAAARRLPLGQEPQALGYLDQEAEALYRQGAEFGDNAALVDAIARCRALLDRRPRARVPLQWATTQNNLGNALSTLGARESGTARLEEAVAAHRAALEELTRARVPLQWAATLNNLGNALSMLGERESGTARLDEAVAAYRAALKERTRARVPLDWAQTQNNLGLALATLGERESGAPDAGRGRLEEAVTAYRAALEEYTRKRVPLDWAMTQNNLGNVLSTLGERESGAPDAGRGRLEEAVTAYRAALEEFTRARVPLHWAGTQNNLGTALATLGQRESGTARLEEAVAACRAALEEHTRERVPLQWAMTQNNLGTALATLGQRESGTAHVEEAVAAFRATLEEITREQGPLQWATTQNHLGSALAMLGERTADASKLKEARDAIAGAFEVFIQADQEQYRAYFEERLRDLDRKVADLTRRPGS